MRQLITFVDQPFHNVQHGLALARFDGLEDRLDQSGRRLAQKAPHRVALQAIAECGNGLLQP
jgi:hypothetical protein